MVLLSLVGAALAFDHSYAAYDAVLDAHVKGGRVAYSALGPTGLDPVLAELAAADASGFTPAQKKAFWINAYNALTIDLIAENPGISSIRDLDGGKVWSTRRFTVAGSEVSLDDIEHKILRPLGDPRVHAAVNCASIGCPAIHKDPYTADGLDAQLTAASRRWVAGNGVVVQGDSVKLNQIFDWFGDDFVAKYGAVHDIPGVDGKQEAALNFIAAHADPELAATLRAGGYTLGWADYDWGLNKR
ncbi:MAG: DUF547 domain-containing protein [Alphaproteobacteria bacterium]|nr:DUF547 domain-containing protein [Alphaproteobacteria bacterium]